MTVVYVLATDSNALYPNFLLKLIYDAPDKKHTFPVAQLNVPNFYAPPVTSAEPSNGDWFKTRGALVFSFI